MNGEHHILQYFVDSNDSNGGCCVHVNIKPQTFKKKKKNTHKKPNMIDDYENQINLR